MNKKEVAKNILVLLNNMTTKVEESNEVQANYYNYITDTIYLSINNDSKQPKGLDNTNPFCGKLVALCHECIHSVQNKILHGLNFVLSNMCIFTTIILVILSITLDEKMLYTILGSIIIAFAILIRMWLELDAIKRSVPLARRYIEKYDFERVDIKDISQAERIIKKLLPVQMIKMILDKIIMLILVIVI